MLIRAVHEKTVRVESTVRNARVDLSEMTVSVVAVETDACLEGKPVTGYAFNSFGRYACAGSLRARFIPRLLQADPLRILDQEGFVDPIAVTRLLLGREKAAGHAERSMALGTLEMALWDAAAKVRGLPLHRHLAERFRRSDPPAERVACYAAGGFYGSDDEVLAARDTVTRFVEAGFRDAKIKAGASDRSLDLARIEAALEVLPPGGRLALDLSCAFDGPGGVGFARDTECYPIWWLEEPCDPLDFEGHRVVQEACGLVAGGENLFSASEVRNFLRYGGLCGIVALMPDPPLSYGVSGMLDILDAARTEGVGPGQIRPHGGNLMSLHVAAGLGLAGAEAYPGMFGIFGGFGQEVAIADGQATLPRSPGTGFEEQPALLSLMRSLHP